MEQRLIKIVGLNSRFTHSCLPLFYLRNELETNCSAFSHEIIQLTINDNYYKTLLRITADSPKFVFFSAAVWNSSIIENLVQDINRCLPHCGIVIGGPQAGVLRERLASGACTTVTGEIEAVDRDFYEDLAGECLKPRYEGSFFAMEKHSFSYPYREEDFESHLKNRHVYYESSRGCPFSCTYCLSAGERGVYHKDLADVEAELTDILHHQPKVVRFIDRTFNDIPGRALAIWKFLAEQDGDTLFHFEIAPERFSEEMFDFLATVPSGRFQFEIGVQSTHVPTLEAVRRKADPERVHDIVSRLAELQNIHLHIDLILGLPFETKESFVRSFTALFAMGAHHIQMGLLKILPDTPICDSVDNFAYTSCVEPPYSILKSRWMDHDCLSELYWFSECVEKFMNNRYFVSLWRYLREGGDDISIFFTELLDICRQSGFFQLAPTHGLMVEKLCGLLTGRKDWDLIRELLRYDWLRCGHRFLPEYLAIDGSCEQPADTRKSLYRILPEEIDSIYKKEGRNHFFKKSFFMRMSDRALQAAGLSCSGREGCVCIVREREDNFYGFNKVLLF
ncbi:MAG: DUF4080 domain-containing protein [Deltaproteobacteria bacterium]|nr:DUF4080 domain-containing protein [Deltaproteobacteria bacterium]